MRVSTMSLVVTVALYGCARVGGAPSGEADTARREGSHEVDHDDDDSDETAVDRLIAALGGEEALREGTNERTTASWARYDAGEAEVVGTTRFVAEGAITTTARLAEDRVRSDIAATSQFPAPGVPLTFSEGIDGDEGFVTGIDDIFAIAAGATSLPDRAAPPMRVSTVRRHADLVTPARAVRRALDGVGTLTAEPPVAGGVSGVTEAVRYREPGAPDLVFGLDANGQLRVTSTLEDHPPLGDTLVEAVYGDWREVGEDDAARPVPYLVTLRADGVDLEVDTRELVELDVDAPDALFALPAGVVAAPADPDAAAFGDRSSQWLRSFGAFGVPLFYGSQIGAPVTSTELAPGVWWMTGPSHHSLLVEMDDHLVLVEAPLYEEWTAGVLDEVHRLSNKPLRTLVATHFHYDHTGGIREIAADGDTTLYASARDTAFFDDVFARPSTVDPDRFAANPTTVTIAPVDDLAVLSDGSGRTVELHHVTNSHADDMLIVYLPNERVLFESDLFSAGFPNDPFIAGELYDEVGRLGLAVDTLVGGHGFYPTTLAEVAATAGR